MKESKIQRAARQAKARGYENIYSVIKSHYDSTYVNLNGVDHVINHGWTAAPSGGNGKWHGPIGINIKELPEKSISRQEAYRLID